MDGRMREIYRIRAHEFNTTIRELPLINVQGFFSKNYFKLMV
jgi:hypothetical protein